MASDYCAALQQVLLQREVLAFHDFSRVSAFAAAQVSVGSLVNSNARLTGPAAWRSLNTPATCR